MKIIILVGTRPEAIKLAPLIVEFKKNNFFDVFVCNSGQHKDMVKNVFELFSIKIDFDLDIMIEHQDLFHITESILNKLKSLFLDIKPDLLVVQGDTTTVFAGALAAFYSKIKIAHVEAGLRTFDIFNPFPEEMNRKFLSNISTYNFAPTETSALNLINEGVEKNSVFVVGNTVVDALNFITGLPVKDKLANVKRLFVTSHRRENHGNNLLTLCEIVKEFANKHPHWEIVWPVHPNPNVKPIVFNQLGNLHNIKLLNPLEYLDVVNYLKNSNIIITDSGGIQEESVALGIPVFVARVNTERKEGLDTGIAKMLTFNLNKDIDELLLAVKEEVWLKTKSSNCYGDGNSSKQIAKIIQEYS
jgi:UDP-N-acetylglucosamine 2-epimerase (non-hydrolysing)